MAPCLCFGARLEENEQEGTVVIPPPNPAVDGVQVRVFSYQDLVRVTNNFREENLIGEGGFGKVYRGVLPTTGQIVAVKKLNPLGGQGTDEFRVEVEMLYRLRHQHLVSLVGYCGEGEERIVVYEYLPSGSLDYHLHDLAPGREPLEWRTRVMIALGAARGLNYLHNEAQPHVIYRDMKSSNILLDANFEAKLSDFGLAKVGPPPDESHVSTRVMGTEGYCAPEYFATGKLTMMSDIYSFGVVLLEIVTGRRPTFRNHKGRKQRLLEWAHPCIRRRTFERLVDPNLGNQYSFRDLRQIVLLAIECIREDRRKRPTSSEIVTRLNDVARDESSSSKSRRRGIIDPLASHPMGGVEVGEEGSGSSSEMERERERERERAVAEARIWGQASREERGESSQNRDLP